MHRSRYSREGLRAALRHHWFPVARLEDLDRPRPAVLLEEPLVVFRDRAGRPRVLSRRCIHRGADLAGGTVVDGGIECPYHGWVFDGGGQCVLVPANADGQRIPSGARVPSYPVLERFGHVWTCLEEPLFDVPTVADFPELDGLDLLWSNGPQFEVPCGFIAQAENFRDVAHFPFVHRQWTGTASHEVPELTARRDGREVWGSVSYPFVPSARFYDTGDSDFRFHAFAPGVGALLIDFGTAGKRFLVNFACPTSHESCVVFWAVAVERTFRGGSLQEIVDLEAMVYHEDRAVISGLQPKEVPMDGEAVEVSVPADAYTLHFRRAAKHTVDAITAELERGRWSDGSGTGS